MGPGEFGQEFGGGVGGMSVGKGKVESDQGYRERALKPSCSSTIISLCPSLLLHSSSIHLYSFQLRRTKLKLGEKYSISYI